MKKKIRNIFIVLVVTVSLFLGCMIGNQKPTDTILLNDIENLMYYHPDKAEMKLDSLHFTMSPKEYRQHSAYILYLQGFLLYQKGMIDSTLTTIEQSLSAFINSGDEKGQAKCQLVLGWVAESVGQWEQAKINYFSALSLQENTNSLTSGMAYLGIGRCKNYLDEDGSEEIGKGTQLLLQTGSNDHKLYGAFMLASYKKDFAKNDIKTLRDIAREFSARGLVNNAANVYKSITLKYIFWDEPDSAMLYINKAMEYHTDIFPGISEKPGLHQVKGLIYYEMNNFNEAFAYLKKAVELYDKYNLKERKYYAYTYLRRIAVERNNYHLAYEYSEKAAAAQRQTRSIDKARVAKLMEISSDIHQLKALIAKLKLQRKISILFMVLGLIIIFLSIRLIIKSNELKQEKLKRKNTELQNLVIGMNEKILMQRRLGNTFETPTSTPKTVSTLCDKFDESYHETLNLFLMEYEVLTNSEARYVLMFALGLNNDTICAVLSVQKSAIRKAKQRICSKLNIPPHQDLEEFFKNFLKRATPFISNSATS